MMKLLSAIAVIFAMLFSPAVFAQSTVVSIATQVKTSQNGHIVVPVVVHDKKGNLIRNLTAADFTLTDNTHPQTIQSFAPDTSLPLTLGILVQTGSGISSWLPQEHRATEKFLTQLMTGSDVRVQSFVIQFNLDVDLLENPSPSTSKLHQALGQLGVPQFNGDSNGTFAGDSGIDSKHRRATGGGAALYDSIYLASSQVLNKESGRKALIVFSDGIDRGSKSTLNSAINAAQTAGVEVYAIYLKGAPAQQEFHPTRNRRGGLGYPGSGYPGGGYPGGEWPGGGSSQPRPPRPARNINGKNILAQICGRTGGEMFDSSRASLKTLLAQIAEQMNDAYILQYTRTKASSDSGFHHIILKPKQKDQFVQMAEGYWLPQQ